MRPIDAALAAPGLERSTWAVVVRSLDRGDTLYALNGGKLLTPASTLKIVTLAAAADVLGWDYTFETRVVATGRINHGTLEGDLVIVGSGDPSLDDWDGRASALFASWADTLRSRGIHTINGRIVGDDRAFQGDAVGAGWAWDDLDASFATSVGALQFNQNTARVSVTPSGPADQPAFRNVSVPNPTFYFVDALRMALTARGIAIRDNAIDVDDVEPAPRVSDGERVIAHRSPPLSMLAQTLMQNSQNLYAETLVKAMGTVWEGAGTFEAGLRAISARVEAWGVPAGEAIVRDGSGLSRYNLVTGNALVAVLELIDSDARLRDSFIAALPAAGRDGTLARRMTGTSADGNVRAKSGSMSNVRGLAGYVTTQDGERLAFAILANNFGDSTSVDATIDRVAVALADFRR